MHESLNAIKQRRPKGRLFYMHTHKCIKCKTEYTDKDEEAYLCEGCNAERLLIAKEIDKKMGSTVGQRPTGGWERIEQLKAQGITRNGIAFINAKDL